MANVKKAKLVTFAPHANFGTCLQSYALNSVLRQMGLDVEFIYNCGENPPVSLIKRIGIKLGLLFPFTAKFFMPKNGTSRKNGDFDSPYILGYPDCPIRKILDGFFLFRLFIIFTIFTLFSYIIDKLIGDIATILIVLIDLLSDSFDHCIIHMQKECKNKDSKNNKSSSNNC